ncbi:glycosyl transferase group 1 [Xylanimonas cellulosilytica DSM 15894]|uniref:Glycosyl transferase group 1 n=1 Tax=Xylanimonas cellulosilytica (strain DSM 15894 / JCM 12276 / CECT 5975 / KCTC 9989 / LMG 20990 / NBRC 107835 / XIL07) TaxID=446471 RepID=D1BVE1_XYLCX|nr:glycosyltransferase [Xylanimonas cellulosilytica]ACZ29412.1 glycosyl transferase group 1 [Xylanimonas cellulosilytica DSM 15894]
MSLNSSPRGLRVLSVYEGFFSGGARQLHSTVVAGLHAGGRQRHAALSIHAEIRRENTLQRMVDDQRFRMLRSAGVHVSTVGRRPDDGLDPRVFLPAELERAAAEVRGAHVVMSLKEQPLRLTNALDVARPVVACLHRSDPEHQGSALGDLLLAARTGRLAAVVCCAESTRDAYRAAGVPDSLLHVVPNGIDLTRFRPVRVPRRRALRGALGLPGDATVVVFAARFDAMKNPALFIAAARQFLERDPAGHVVLCGAGMSEANPDLMVELGLAFGDRPDLLDRVHALGVRPDMEQLYAVADVVALTSVFGEASPLCLMEGAMCGAIPVTTPVGDSARTVDGIGFVTGFDAAEIAETWIEAAARRDELAGALTAARPRFSHVRMLAGYAQVLESAERGAGARFAVA